MSNTTGVLHVLAPMREGGLERVVTMLAVGQRNNGAHVAAVIEPAEAGDHTFVERASRLGIPVTAIVVGAREYFREYRELKVVMARLKPTVVHTHGYRADVIAGAAARASRVPVVSTVHGFTGGGLRNQVYERIQLHSLRRADAVVAVSSPLVRRLLEAGVSADRIWCIPNGFSPNGTIHSRANARKKLGIADDEFVIGWVGRLSREKGADVMLQSLAAGGTQWRLSIVGDGPEAERLRAMASTLGVTGRIRWHGAVGEAGTLMSAFDVFVLSSRTEGTPITLFEAMAARVPIVATRVGGVPDVISESDAQLVTSEDPRGIAAAIGIIEGDPPAARIRAAHANERLKNSFAAEAWIEKVETVYEAVSRRSHNDRER